MFVISNGNSLAILKKDLPGNSPYSKYKIVPMKPCSAKDITV
jgi:hypothetical protein